MRRRPSNLPAAQEESCDKRRRRRHRVTQKQSTCAIAVALLLLCERCSAAVDTLTSSSRSSSVQWERKPIPLIRSVEGATTLELAPEGLAFLRSLPGIAVAPVVVMGPYRSGKSFLLNQLLGVGCDEGFGVGHTRATQTKGVWIWGAPEMSDDDEESSKSGDAGNERRYALLFVDSEGFESTGKSDAYDDRIFALGATLSSLLVYNLPEALRESDVEKLSFATQLAGSLFSAPSDDLGGRNKKSRSTNSLEPGSMLWLIQRDFLGGSTPQSALDAALAAVPNPSRDAGISAVNKVRSSLRRIAPKSTAFGLPQPHLDRTRLCELGDAALAPEYIEKRGELRRLVRRLARPKRKTAAKGSGDPGSSESSSPAYVDGPALADLAERIVGALNSKQIPTAGSILEHFNADLVREVVAGYSSRMGERLPPERLPVSEGELGREHEAASAEAVAAFEARRFGGVGADVGGDGDAGDGDVGLDEGGDALRSTLLGELSSAASAFRDRNELASSRACSSAAERCEDALDAEQRSRVPSRRRFEQRLEESCSPRALSLPSKKSTKGVVALGSSSSSASSVAMPGCVGPAAEAALARARRAVDRERARFKASYNDKLLSGLLVAALAVVAAGRFVLRSTLVEVAGWGCFAFLQLYPKSFLVSGSSRSMYESKWWLRVASAWEVLVRYPALDAAVAGMLVFWGVRRSLRRCREARRARKGKGSGGGRRKRAGRVGGDSGDDDSLSDDDSGKGGGGARGKKTRGRLAALVLGGGYRGGADNNKRGPRTAYRGVDV